MLDLLNSRARDAAHETRIRIEDPATIHKVATDIDPLAARSLEQVAEQAAAEYLPGRNEA